MSAQYSVSTVEKKTSSVTTVMINLWLLIFSESIRKENFSHNKLEWKTQDRYEGFYIRIIEYLLLRLVNGLPQRLERGADRKYLSAFLFPKARQMEVLQFIES